MMLAWRTGMAATASFLTAVLVTSDLNAAHRGAKATVTILQAPISQRLVRILSFGAFKTAGEKKCQPGTIRLSRSSEKGTKTVEATGGVHLRFRASVDKNLGEFRISGTPNVIYNVALPRSAQSAPHGLPVTDFTFWSRNTQSSLRAETGPRGNDTLHIGATLSVPCPIDTGTTAETVPNYEVTVSYQ